MGVRSKTKKKWFRIIQAARKRGRFTDNQRVYAAQWTTCACGEQDPRIPRLVPGSDAYRNADDGPWCPVDWRLRSLGLEFATQVENNQFNAALNTLRMIEERSAYLIKEYEVRAKRVEKAKKAAAKEVRA